jgi:hypothetical protein
MGSLTEDPAFLATTFVVVDFETTTPTGHPAQPVEVAALAFRRAQGAWARSGSFTSLIQPPAFAPVTPAHTAQSGITAEQVAQAPAPADPAAGRLAEPASAETPAVLAEVRARVTAMTMAARDRGALVLPPLLVLGTSERVGSNWFSDTLRPVMDQHSEPFRQQPVADHPLSALSPRTASSFTLTVRPDTGAGDDPLLTSRGQV